MLSLRRWLARRGCCGLLGASVLAFGALRAEAQAGAFITGRVVEAATGRGIGQATVSIDGLARSARTDSAGVYRLAAVPPGPQVLVVRALGYSLARVPVTVPAIGRIVRDVELARTALQMPQVRVTAEGIGRARGELGTATVINRDAIQVQNAVSLAGLLELLPGIPLQTPGLEGTQQVALRAVPTPSGIAERTSAFGTLIVMDGVPMSNNANLQSTGPRGEFVLGTAAGGSIDLRRIPATMLDRVEVIRGVPSARYGDLTAGAIVIETRAGALPTEVVGRFDPSTTGGALASGRALSARQDVSITSDLTRTQVAPGVRDASVWRGALNVAHRLVRGSRAQDDPPGTRVDEGPVVLDTRLSAFQVYRSEPEQRDVRPGLSSEDRSGGVRLAERARFGMAARRHLEVTASLEHEWQLSRAQQYVIRGAEPFTDRLTPGTSVGRFVQGTYLAALQLQGLPWHLYTRAEGVLPGDAWGGVRTFRAGVELRRDWTGGAGYHFEIASPPQVAFNGINGYDRPRRFDAVPPVASSAVYLDARLTRSLWTRGAFDVQAGVRVDALHSGGWWSSSARDAAVQPRISVEVAPRPWLRLRGGLGITAKQPTTGDLYPAPQYFDVVNVNWFPPNPAERLAVLTTSIVDPTNARLGLAIARKHEVGIEIDLGHSGAAMSVVGFRDETRGGVGFEARPSHLLRGRFTLSDTTIGSGRPPTYSATPTSTDTVPVFVDVPANLNAITNTGVEWTFSLPEIPALHLRAEITGAWAVTRLVNDALDFGPFSRLAQFQLDPRQSRTAYWRGDRQRGERSLATARVVHHQPALGLVITGTLQYFLHERNVQEGASDTLAWRGYVTRTGELVAVPASARVEAQYADLRRPRQGLVTIPASPPPDWLLSVQLTKTVLGSGRLSFYAFNALDRLGEPSRSGRLGRLFPRSRFGLEVTLPLMPRALAR